MLAVWQATIVNEVGNIQVGASVQVLLESSGSPATLFSDRDGTNSISNPVTADSNGFVRFYAAGNAYRINATLGAFTRTWRHVAIGLLGERDAVPESFIRYGRTTAEIAASVTPTNESIPSHDVLRHVVPQRYGVTGNGTTDDYAAMARANSVAVAAGAALVLGNGTYCLDTSLAFGVPVVMEGGIIAGKGTVSFPKGFHAPLYYCFDCLVGVMNVETVYAEWFGARRSTDTPTSTFVDITKLDTVPPSPKPWNDWPAWVTGATFGANPGHDYGDAAFLSSNRPFANSDTWDFIGVQRALWSLGQVSDNRRGQLTLLGGNYKWNKPVRYTGEMASSIQGAGRTKTLIDSPDWAAQGTINVDGPDKPVAVRALLHFYRVGPDPIVIDGLCFAGPNGYVFGGSPLIYLVTHIGANGVNHRNQYLTVGDVGWFFGSSCSDCTLEDFHAEYCRRSAYGFDALSWATIRNGAFWQSGAGAQAIDFRRYVFVHGCELFHYTLEPLVYGEGSHLSAITLLQFATDRKTEIDGTIVKRQLQIPAGGSSTVLTVKMPAHSAIRTRMVAGGVVQGVGTVGIERTLKWYREAGSPTAAGSAATKWGSGGATALISEALAAGADNFSLIISNAGAAGQVYDMWVTIEIEGSDCTLQGLT